VSLQNENVLSKVEMSVIEDLATFVRVRAAEQIPEKQRLLLLEYIGFQVHSHSGPIPRMVRLSVSLWLVPLVRTLPSPLCSVAHSVEKRTQNKRVGSLEHFIASPRIHRTLIRMLVYIRFDGATSLRTVDNCLFSHTGRL
jgi:hypothetical protein